MIEVTIIPLALVLNERIGIGLKQELAHIELLMANSHLIHNFSTLGHLGSEVTRSLHEALSSLIRYGRRVAMQGHSEITISRLEHLQFGQI